MIASFSPDFKAASALQAVSKRRVKAKNNFDLHS
jgi:hypothetical protein